MRPSRWWSLLPLCAAGSCTTNHGVTELVVVVATDINPATIQRVRVTALREGAGAPLHDQWYPIAAGAGLDAGRVYTLPGEVALVSSDPDDDRRLAVDVAVDMPGDDQDFTQRALVRFRPYQLVYLEMFLADRCTLRANRDVCGEGTVCGQRGCQPVDQTARTVEPDVAATADLTYDRVTVDAPDASDIPAAKDAPDVIDAPDVVDVVDAADVVDAVDAPDVIDVIDVTDASDASDVIDVIDVIDVTDAGVCAPCTPGGVEVCYDGRDNNCNGLTDEGCRSRTCPDGGVAAGGASATGCGEALIDPGDAGFAMGEAVDAGEDAATLFAQPVVDGVRVSPFRIDRYEVTVARFRAFWAAGHPAPPCSEVGYPGGTVTSAMYFRTPWPTTNPVVTTDAGVDPTCHLGSADGALDNHPVNCIDWFTAMAFCVWDGGRLPTEAEWEYVARYRDVRVDGTTPLPVGRRYPWGNDPVTCIGNYLSGRSCESFVDTWPVGTNQPAWMEVFDLGGNVSEWVADRQSEYGTEPCWGSGGHRDPVCRTGGLPVHRGGSWMSPEILVRAGSRLASTPDRVDVGRGIRCVRTP